MRSSVPSRMDYRCLSSLMLVGLLASVDVTKPDCEPLGHDGVTSINLWSSRSVELSPRGTRQDKSSGGRLS